MNLRPILLLGLLFTACSASPSADERVVPDVEPGRIEPSVMNGAIDTANAFSNVGAMVIDDSGAKQAICSGTLIAPRVFLTASHCTVAFSEAWVSFDVAFNAASSPIFHGTPVTNPLYSIGGNSDPHDIAVILLDAAPPGVTPAQLPARGAFDNVDKDQTFTAVGYGVYSRTNGHGGPPDFLFDATRRVATSTFNSVNQAWLRLSMNPAKGDGGTCFGDSGGPNFFGTTNVIGGLTVTGDSVCRATNVIYRVDTDSARSFLGQYMTLP
jgi:secreted trypsin-like serine protease